MIETRGPEEKPVLGEPPMVGTSDVGAQRVALVYAEALFDAADPKGQVEAVLEELRSLVNDVFRAQPELERLLASPAIGRDRRAGLIRKALEGRTSDVFLNFLLVLNKHDRLELLRAVLGEAEVLNDKRHNRVRVDIRTAVALPDDQREQLRSGLRDVLQSEPVLNIKIDPELIGGIVVQAGDYQYDGSVRKQLQNIQSQLVERGSHEIQSGRDRFSSDTGN
jgi:F-type H+-transporting ATPase subunit delta